jgi:hypothetical protein
MILDAMAIVYEQDGSGNVVVELRNVHFSATPSGVAVVLQREAWDRIRNQDPVSLPSDDPSVSEGTGGPPCGVSGVNQGRPYLKLFDAPVEATEAQ